MATLRFTTSLLTLCILLNGLTLSAEGLIEESTSTASDFDTENNSGKLEPYLVAERWHYLRYKNVKTATLFNRTGEDISVQAYCRNNMVAKGSTSKPPYKWSLKNGAVGVRQIDTTCEGFDVIVDSKGKTSFGEVALQSWPYQHIILVIFPYTTSITHLDNFETTTTDIDTDSSYIANVEFNVEKATFINLTSRTVSVTPKCTDASAINKVRFKTIQKEFSKTRQLKPLATFALSLDICTKIQAAFDKDTQQKIKGKYVLDINGTFSYLQILGKKLPAALRYEDIRVLIPADID